MDGPDGWIMAEVNNPYKPTPLEDADTEELDLDELWGVEPDEMPKERQRAPGCTCGLVVPDDECPIDHMGRRKPDPEPEGGGK